MKCNNGECNTVDTEEGKAFCLDCGKDFTEKWKKAEKEIVTKRKKCIVCGEYCLYINPTTTYDTCCSCTDDVRPCVECHRRPIEP